MDERLVLLSVTTVGAGGSVLIISKMGVLILETIDFEFHVAASR